MNTKFFKLNEKLLLLSKSVENSQKEIEKNNEKEEEEKNVEFHHDKFESKIKINHSTLLKNKIEALENNDT